MPEFVLSASYTASAIALLTMLVFCLDCFHEVAGSQCGGWLCPQR